MPEVQEQPSTVQATTTAPVPDVQQAPVHEDFPPIIEPVQAPSPIHTQDEPMVSLPKPHPSINIETLISEQQIPSQPQPNAPISSSSPPQPSVEPTPHESSHEPINEPIQIEDSPQHSMDTYCPLDAYAQVFPKSSQHSVPSVPSAPHSEPQVQSSKPAVSIIHPSKPIVQQVQTSIPSSTSTPSEWHRHGVPTTATISAPDLSAQEQSVLFRFISA